MWTRRAVLGLLTLFCHATQARLVHIRIEDTFGDLTTDDQLPVYQPRQYNTYCNFTLDDKHTGALSYERFNDGADSNVYQHDATAFSAIGLSIPERIFYLC